MLKGVEVHLLTILNDDLPLVGIRVDRLREITKVFQNMGLQIPNDGVAALDVLEAPPGITQDIKVREGIIAVRGIFGDQYRLRRLLPYIINLL